MDQETFMCKLDSLLLHAAELSGEEVESIVDRLEKMAPNSEITDLLAFAEVDRTADEIVKEVIAREKIFSVGGAAAVSERIIKQMTDVLDGASINTPRNQRGFVHSAYKILSHKDPSAAREYEELIESIRVQSKIEAIG